MGIDVVVAVRVSEADLLGGFGGRVEIDEGIRFWTASLGQPCPPSAMLGDDCALFLTGFGAGITVGEALQVVRSGAPGLLASLSLADDVALGLGSDHMHTFRTFAELARHRFVPADVAPNRVVFDVLYGGVPTSPLDAARRIMQVLLPNP